MKKPVQIIIYGSSLFLLAVAASLYHFNSVELILLPATTAAEKLIAYTPTVILCLKKTVIPNWHLLLKAGFRLIEIDDQKSYVTLYCFQHHPQQYPINQTKDLLALIL